MRWSALAGLGLLATLTASVLHYDPEPILKYSAVSFPAGRPVATADLRGKPALLTSWATWCTVCPAELRQLELYRRAHRASALQIVAINVDGEDSAQTALEWTKKLDLSYALWRDPTDRFTAVVGGVGVPTSVLLDARGKVVRRWQGRINLSEAETLDSIERLVTGAD